jgi:hypothetical protein
MFLDIFDTLVPRLVGHKLIILGILKLKINKFMYHAKKREENPQAHWNRQIFLFMYHAKKNEKNPQAHELFII